MKSKLSNYENKKMIIIIVISIVIVITAGYIVVNRLMPINISEEFIPISIEIEIDNEIQNIELTEKTQSIILSVFQFESWEKSKINSEIITTAYLKGENNKTIVMHKTEDDRTLFRLETGFGLHNGSAFQGSIASFNRIKTDLIQHQVPVDEVITVNTVETDCVEIGKLLFEKYIERYMKDEIFERMEIQSYKINRAELYGGDNNKFVVVLNVDVIPKDLQGSYWYMGIGGKDSTIGLAIKQISENTYQLLDLCTGGFGYWLKDN